MRKNTLLGGIKIMKKLTFVCKYQVEAPLINKITLEADSIESAQAKMLQDGIIVNDEESLPFAQKFSDFKLA